MKFKPTSEHWWTLFALFYLMFHIWAGLYNMLIRHRSAAINAACAIILLVALTRRAYIGFEGDSDDGDDDDDDGDVEHHEVMR